MIQNLEPPPLLESMRPFKRAHQRRGVAMKKRGGGTGRVLGFLLLLLSFLETGHAREMKQVIVQSPSSGLNLRVELPLDWSHYRIPSAADRQSGAGQGARTTEDLIFSCHKKGEKGFLALEKILTLRAEQKLTAPEVKRRFMAAEVAFAEDFGSLEEAWLTLLGQPAFGIRLEDDEGDVTVIIVMMEALEGWFYKLESRFETDDSLNAMSLRDFAASVTLTSASKIKK